MPRFFFHRTDGFVDNDPEGVDLANLETARTEAIKYAGATLAEDPDLVWDGQEYRIEVTDDVGKLLLTVIVLAVEVADTRRTIPS